MPIGRFNVRNEYGLGVKELYKDGVESEDPKVVIDGVAVAGLVGLLRQLGDLSQFAAEVFHDLQERVACTVSRSRKLVTRVQRVEASLPSVEKAIMSQTSHIHFAYSPGSEWHPRIKNEQNHLICDDLPHFIMDSYEECHEPPCLQLLDRFDMGGPGSCVKRYSDPTFFRRASNSSETCNKEKSLRERKASKIKKRSQNRRKKFPICVPISNNSESIKVYSEISREASSLSHAGSTFDKNSRSDRGYQSDLVGSKVSIQPIKTNIVDTTVPPGSDVTWDEEREILVHMSMNFEIENNQRAPENNHYLHQKDMKPVSAESIDQVDGFSGNRGIAKSMDSIMNVKLMAPTEMDYLHEGAQTFDAKNSRVDQLSEVTSCTESDADGNCRRTTIDKKFVESNGPNYIHGQDLKPINTKSFSNIEGLPEHGSSSDSNSHEKYPTTILDWGLELNQKDNGIGEVHEVDETNLDRHEHAVAPFPQVTNFSEGGDGPHEDKLVLANPESFPQLKGFHYPEKSLKLIDNGNLMGDSFDCKLCIGDVQYMIDTIENKKWAIETIKAEPIDSSIAQVRELISDAHYMHETTLANAKLKAGTINEKHDGLVDNASIEEVSNANLIGWPHHEDIDCETDNFVDALYTIDSESENEHETRNKRGVESLAFTCQLGNALTDPVVDKIDHSKPEHNPFGRCDCKHEVYDGLDRPTSSAAPLTKLEYLENGAASHHSEAATSQEERSPKSLSTASLGIEVCANTDETRLGNLEGKGSGETPFGSTDAYPHAFWSNGTLFGLQPSKPAVINMSNSGNCNIVDPCISKADDPGKTMSSTMNNYDHGDNIDSYRQGAGLLKTYTKFLDHDEKNTNHDSTVPGLVNGHVTIPKSHDISSADLKNVNFEATNGIGDRSSLLSLLGHNLLKNSLRRSGSLDYDDMDKPNDVAVSDTVPRSHFNGELQSSVNSPPPSPPLELMKISFRPVDGFETSKLQLRYPERTDNHEINVDTFPSFQLVPESTRLPHDMGSDSDNDTFCRSCHCASDASVSHLSDSDSQQWESGDIIVSNNYAFYDGSRGMSSTESASSSFRHENTDQQSMHTGSRNFLSPNPTSQLSVLGTKNNFELQDSTPQLPPLPPSQWCVSRPVLKEPENKPSSAVSETAEDDLAKLHSRMLESDTIVKDRKVTKATVDDQNQNSPAADGKTMNEHGDFLHQIRTKSFNLKRTDAARLPHSPSPAPSNKVSAILQKAGAIRKVVGSDDDSWSDT